VISRRAFLGALAGGLLASSLAAEAQQATKVPRLGYLSLFSASNPYPPSEALWQGMRDLGSVEGQNIAIEWRFAEGGVMPEEKLIAKIAKYHEERESGTKT